MKNKIYIFYLTLMVVFVLRSLAENNKNIKADPFSEQELNKKFELINFDTFPKISRVAFTTAYRGYLALLQAGNIAPGKNLLAICDYSLSSVERRFWIIDLALNKVLYHTLMAHGQGSGEEYARQFSNREHSHQTSLGFYITGDTYIGKHGLSLYLHGMDDGFNSAAYQRSVVMHGADYVSEQFIQENQRLGRSWGCPALPTSVSTQIINLLKQGMCFFAYYPSADYAQSSCWLKKQIPTFPHNPFLLQPSSVPDGNESEAVVAKED